MDRLTRLRPAALGFLLLLCGGCHLLRPKPMIMDLNGFEPVEQVRFTEGGYRSEPGGGEYLAVLRWHFQNPRGHVHLDQTATWRYLLTVRFSPDAGGQLRVDRAELIVASFNAADRLEGVEIKANLTLDDRQRLCGTLVGSWHWAAGTQAAGPVNCPRVGVFSGRLNQVAYDPQRVEKLLVEVQQHRRWIRSARIEPAS
jgi:hypothetical protein